MARPRNGELMSTVREPSTDQGIIAWFTRNTVAANLMMGLIVVSGLLVLPIVKKEVFPELTVAVVAASVAYPGASPNEVEESICQRIEEAVQGLTGVKRVTSTASENVGAVSIEAISGFDVSQLLADVKNRVDAIDTFPEEAEKPIVQQVLIQKQVINVAISGDTDERSLKELGQEVRDDLARLPQITQVELTNVRPYELSIEVSEDQLRRYGLTFQQVANAVRQSSLDLPGGTIKSAAGEIQLRTKGQAYVGAEFEQLVLLTRRDGSRVTLGDVATVVDGFADTDLSSRFDGKPAVLVQVFRVGDQSVLEVAAAVSDYVASAQPRLPTGITLTTWRDQTKLLESRMSLLLRNAATGLLLVFLVLALFLRFKLAVWVSLGIPVSFLGAIALMPTFDVSVNMVSLFAFIVVLGIVVDDAIVVGENVYKHLRQGMAGIDAAIIGSRQVAVPVTFGVMTTVAAFSPMLNVDSDSAELWRQIPLIVIPCLLFSLLESKLILPAHLSHQRPPGEEPPPRGLSRLVAPVGSLWQKLQWPFNNGLEWFVAHVYQPTLEFATRWRYPTWAAGIATLTITTGLLAAGWIHFDFFPTVEGDNIVGSVTMPEGTAVESTTRAVRRLEVAALDLKHEIDSENPGQPSAFEHVLTSIGDQPYKVETAMSQGKAGASAAGSNRGEVNIQLAPSEDRTLSSDEILRRWRQKVVAIPGAVELSFTSSLITSGADIDILLSAEDTDELRRAADALKQQLATYSGTLNIADSLRAGKVEVILSIKPSAEALGLTLSDLARQVRQAFYGEEAQRIQRGRDEVRVMVRYPQEHRLSLGDLERMLVRTPAGDEVPLSAVANLEEGRGYATIKRTDMARSVNVTADVDASKSNTNQIVADIETTFVPDLKRRFPGVTMSFEGDSQEQRRTLDSLFRGFVVALFIIYALMAVPFRSYVQPLIVMMAIPFGLVGAIWGHVIMGMEMSIVSMLGLVALTGVVINDSLVLVDYINSRRQAGHSVRDAVLHAGADRFRPILLTSLTTFAGLTPMLLERSVQAQFLMPMAVSLAFGVMFATVISLVLVPCGYLILADLGRAGSWLIGRQVEPLD